MIEIFTDLSRSLQIWGYLDIFWHLTFSFTFYKNFLSRFHFYDDLQNVEYLNKFVRINLSNIKIIEGVKGSRQFCRSVVLLLRSKTRSGLHYPQLSKISQLRILEGFQEGQQMDQRLWWNWGSVLILWFFQSFWRQAAFYARCWRPEGFQFPNFETGQTSTGYLNGTQTNLLINWTIPFWVFAKLLMDETFVSHD